MRIVLLTCLWKRFELTKVVLRATQRLQKQLAPNIQLDLLAVGSEGPQSKALAESCGFDTIDFPNTPLSRKWNRGAQVARDYDPDGVIIVGSDDVRSENLIRWHARQHEQGRHFFGLLDLFFFDLASLNLGYWAGNRPSGEVNRVGEPIGCGRCFSRSLLDKTEWNLWPHESPRDCHLDALTYSFLTANGFDCQAWRMHEIGAPAVDIKTSVNINSFEMIDYDEIIKGPGALGVLGPLLGEEGLGELLDLHKGSASKNSTSGHSDGVNRAP